MSGRFLRPLPRRVGARLHQAGAGVHAARSVAPEVELRHQIELVHRPQNYLLLYRYNMLQSQIDWGEQRRPLLRVRNDGCPLMLLLELKTVGCQTRLVFAWAH